MATVDELRKEVAELKALVHQLIQQNNAVLGDLDDVRSLLNTVVARVDLKPDNPYRGERAEQGDLV